MLPKIFPPGDTPPPPPTPPIKMVPGPTWNCTFEVTVDLPVSMTPQEMERAIANCLSVRLPALGLASNCIVSLLSTAGNVTIVDQVATSLMLDMPLAGTVSTGDSPIPDLSISAATPDSTPSGSIPINPIGAV